jgi:hypothetical protein
MSRDELVQRLRVRRRRLLTAYLGFLSCFFFTGALAAADASSSALGPAILLVLVATLPILILNIGLHHAIRALRPAARSVGAKHAVVSALLFSPFEAALVLPAINLWVSRKVLREIASGAQQCVGAVRERSAGGRRWRL